MSLVFCITVSILSFLSECIVPTDSPDGGTYFECNANFCECPSNLIEDFNMCVGMLPFDKGANRVLNRGFEKNGTCQSIIPAQPLCEQ